MSVASKKPATFEELAARESSDRLEIVGGDLVEKAMPSVPHSFSETKLASTMPRSLTG